MAEIKGTPKVPIGFKILPDLLIKINDLIKSGRFPSQASVIEAALTEYFYRNELTDQIKKFLESDEGKDLIKKIMNESSSKSD